MPTNFLNRVVNKVRNRLVVPPEKKEYQSILKSIENKPEFWAIRDKYKVTNPSYIKYFDMKKTVEFCLKRAFMLGLYRPARPLNILDLGSGFGVFAYICNRFGHMCEGLDLDIPGDANCDLFREVWHVLNKTTRHSHKINPLEPLPALGHRYDVVTAFQVCFDNFGTPEAWGAAQWKFFLKDLRKNVLTPNGRVFLRMNKPDEVDYFLSDDVARLFTEHGGKIDGAYILFANASTLPGE